MTYISKPVRETSAVSKVGEDIGGLDGWLAGFFLEVA